MPEFTFDSKSPQDGSGASDAMYEAQAYVDVLPTNTDLGDGIKARETALALGGITVAFPLGNSKELTATTRPTHTITRGKHSLDEMDSSNNQPDIGRGGSGEYNTPQSPEGEKSQPHGQEEPEVEDNGSHDGHNNDGPPDDENSEAGEQDDDDEGSDKEGKGDGLDDNNEEREHSDLSHERFLARTEALELLTTLDIYTSDPGSEVLTAENESILLYALQAINASAGIQATISPDEAIGRTTHTQESIPIDGLNVSIEGQTLSIVALLRVDFAEEHGHSVPIARLTINVEAPEGYTPPNTEEVSTSETLLDIAVHRNLVTEATIVTQPADREAATAIEGMLARLGFGVVKVGDEESQYRLLELSSEQIKAVNAFARLHLQ